MTLEYIDASPTKEFFIDMLVRDIDLDRSILDLIDNSVDAWVDGGRKKESWVRIEFNDVEFKISDNCGGMDFELAKTYAFRFGRPKEREATPNSVGQFGVGMKRTLFKLGKSFEIVSRKNDLCFKVNVNVDNWKSSNDWNFEIEKIDKNTISEGHTTIIVRDIFPNVKQMFELSEFSNKLDHDCSKAYFTSLNKELDIIINEKKVVRHKIELMKSGKILPAFKKFSSNGVSIKVYSGIGKRSLKQGGWYVICNGRLVLAAEQSEITGWRDGQIPQYHPDYAYFRGVVEFESEDSSLLPWTTTKTGVDKNNKAYLAALFEMKKQMLNVILFLKDRVKEEKQIKLYQIEETQIADAINQSDFVEYSTLVLNDRFIAPERIIHKPVSKVTKVQYTVANDRLELAKKSLKVDTATSVGLMTFDYYMSYEVDDE